MFVSYASKYYIMKDMILKKLTSSKLALASTIILLLLLLFFTSRFLFGNKGSFDSAQFRLVAIEQGPLVKTVNASGQINPVNVVNVGTQVSGIIEKIFVDYNDKVQANQILAQLDKSILQADVNDSQTQLERAEAERNLAKINFDRYKELYEQSYVSKSEVDELEAKYQIAMADVSSARNQLERNKINLDYAEVKSPVSGVVLSREVDIGQTMQSSFETPTLFQIAVDLGKMQIEASISEADIGLVKPGQAVDFSVDAYSELKFEGQVSQVRLEPIVEQNVVTYNVIVDIDNPDLLLMPGMTAYVNIRVDQRNQVLKVPSSALRFNPDTHLKLAKPIGESSDNMIYRFQADHIQPIYVEKGLETLLKTEVSSDALKAGDQIIISENRRASRRSR